MKKAVIIGSANLLTIKIQNVLQNNGFRSVDIYKNQDTLNVKRHKWEDVDCFIIDLDNGEGDMIQIIKELRTHENLKAHPIITLSSNSEFKTLKCAIAAGCSEFLVKPFDMSVLLTRVHKLCRKEIREGKSDQTGVNRITNQNEINMKNDCADPNELENLSEQAYTLKWIRDFEIGVEQIDDEHREIIYNFNKLYSLMKAGKGHDYYVELLFFLKSYIVTHFAHEEKIQKDNGYPEYEQHRNLHMQFSSEVMTMEKCHVGDSATNIELIHMSLYIRDWLYHHILVEDVKVGEFIKNNAKES